MGTGYHIPLRFLRADGQNARCRGEGVEYVHENIIRSPRGRIYRGSVLNVLAMLIDYVFILIVDVPDDLRLLMWCCICFLVCFCCLSGHTLGLRSPKWRQRKMMLRVCKAAAPARGVPHPPGARSPILGFNEERSLSAHGKGLPSLLDGAGSLPTSGTCCRPPLFSKGTLDMYCQYWN